MRRMLTPMLVVVSLFAAALPAQAKAAPELLSVDVPAITAGSRSWIAINWRGTGDVSDFRVTARAIGGSADVEIGYPENTGSYTSLYNDAELSSDETDFTALHLVVPYAVDGKVQLQLQVSYVDEGKSRQRTHVVQVPVVEHTGADLELVTTEASIGTEGGWVPLWFSGMAPSLTDFTVVVSDPAGLEVAYPSDGSSTSLSYDAVLVRGESDYVAFRVLPGALAPGSHSVGIEATYRKGAETGTRTGTVTIEVEG